MRSVTNNQTDLIYMHFITDEFNVIRYSEANNNVHYVKNIRICVSEFLIGENAIMTRKLVKSDSGKYDFVFITNARFQPTLTWYFLRSGEIG